MLERFRLLSNLTEQQRQLIESVSKEEFFRKGDRIFEEGECSHEIYFLISGKVDLYKIEPETHHDLKFKQMFPGQSFGEMSFVDNSPRSCSVVAAEDSKAYILDKENLLKRSPEAIEVVNALTLATTRQVNSYLRYLSDRHVEKLQEQIEDLQERTDFGYFLVFLLVLMLGMAIVNAGINEFFPPTILTSQLFSWVFLIVGFGIPLALSAWKTRLSAKEIGFTKVKLKKSAIDGILFTSIGVAIAIAVAASVDRLVPGQHLIQNLRNATVPVGDWFYFIHSYIQEALRAVVQISIQRFLMNKSQLVAIGATALIFGVCHMHFGLIAILLTLITSVIFGLIYIRTYNLLGVSIFHFVMGVVVFKNLLGY